MLSVNFNGHELNKYIRVLSGFTLLKGAEFFLGLQDIDGGNGSRVFNAHYGSKTIPMPFKAHNYFINKYDELQRILKVDEPKPLIFGNAPDRIYYAMPIGDMDMDEFLNFGKGTITWVVPDGLAHATEETEFPATVNADGILEATIINGGTAPVPISYDITHTAENGYIGIASSEGAMEFGAIEEADGEDYQMSEKLIDTTDFSDWEEWTSSAQDPNRTVSLKLLANTDTDGPRLGDLTGTPVVDGKPQIGVSRIMLKPDSNGVATAPNFYGWVKQWFETNRMGQTGTCGVNFVATDGSLIASYMIEKGDKVGNLARLFMITGDKPQAAKNVIEFTPSNSIAKNPYCNERGGGGPWDLRKVGSMITFYWYGKYYNYDIPGLETKELAWVEYVAGQWSGASMDRMATGGMVNAMHLRYLSVTKLKVEKWMNVPNRYPAGSVFTIDGNETVAYVDGKLALDDEVIGTNYFLAPVGETKIQFYMSSWCTDMPDIKIRIRKAWL